jgi:hypothetical protein
VLNPYLLYIKLGIAALILAVFGFFAYKVHSWRQDALELGVVRQEMADLKASQEASQKASQGYQDELAEIRARPVTTGPVRLCNKRPAVSPTGSGPSPALPASGVLQGADGSDYQEGPDIAADLLRLADEADEVAAKGRATQSLHLPLKR